MIYSVLLTEVRFCGTLGRLLVEQRWKQLNCGRCGQITASREVFYSIHNCRDEAVWRPLLHDWESQSRIVR